MRKVRHNRLSNLPQLVTTAAGWWRRHSVFLSDPQLLLYKGADFLVVFHSFAHWWMLLCLTRIWRGQLGVAERAQAQVLRDLGPGLAWASGSPSVRYGDSTGQSWRSFLHQESIFLWFPTFGKKLPIISTTAEDANSFANVSAKWQSRDFNPRAPDSKSLSTSSWVRKRKELKQRERTYCCQTRSMWATELGPMSKAQEFWWGSWPGAGLLHPLVELVCNALACQLFPFDTRIDVRIQEAGSSRPKRSENQWPQLFS